MYKTVKRKSLSIVIVLALVVSMFSGLGLTASASVPATAVPYTGQAAQGDYTIQTAAQLAQLAIVVNGKTPYSYSGSNFWLIKDIDLSKSDTYDSLSWTGGTNWTPIGGMCNETSYVPVGPYFSGTFNGSPDDGTYCYGVSNMNINATGIDASIMSGWGLFGAANGNIANLNVSGTITLTRASGYSGEVHYAGGIVGYTAASVYNCQANMTITVDNGANLGTVVGGIESTERSQLAAPLVVEYCIGTGNVTGAFEVGGIVGGAYCQTGGDGNVRIGYSAYKGGTLRTTNTAQRAYVGGICGYNKGWIAYSYATNITLVTGNGHYLAGAVGHQEGRGPFASIYNSYANIINYGTADPSVDRPFIGTVDNSNVIPINNCVWTAIDGFDQPEGTGSSGWGLWNSATTQLENVGDLNTQGTVNILGNTIFAVGQGTATSPVMQWESIRPTIYVDPINPSAPTIPGGMVTFPDTDAADQIFVDGTQSVNGDGSHDNPFNNIGDGLTALNASATQTIIYIRNMVTLSTSTSIASTKAGATIMRSSTYSGYLFNLTGGTTSVANIAIDGNKSAFKSLTIPTPTASLFAVRAGATLTIANGATLQNNYAGDGGAISVIGGVLGMSGGQIISNEAANSGGGVVIHQRGVFNMSGGTIGGAGTGIGNVAGNNGGGVAAFNDGNFNFSGGTISYNTASSGGGVFAGSGGTTGGAFNMTGGTITSNIATGNGGAVYVDVGGTFELDSGTITGNRATIGQGVYAAWNTGIIYPIMVNPGANDVINVPDTIYLAGSSTGSDSTRITLSATLTSATIGGNMQTPFVIRVTNPSDTRVVATATNSTMASNSAQFFKTWQGDDMADSGANIIYDNFVLLS